MLSSAVVKALRTGRAPVYAPAAVLRADPWGEDLQLGLHLLYELHYRGFEGVADDLEWDPDLLRLRNALETRFLHALRGELADAPRSVEEAFAPLLVEPVDPSGSLSHRLETEGELWQLREYAALRSLYHLREADPHAWVIPRLTGRAKAAMVAIEYDEFGAGHADRIHARLFADLMGDLGLDPGYGHYLDRAPAPLLATVNLMSLLGLHRALRGALVGHFACVEVTSSPGPAAWPRPCAGAGRARPPNISTPSTWRRTPSTNRSCATRSSAGCWPTSPRWSRTSPSAARRRSCWRTGWPPTSARPGTRAGRPCARPRCDGSRVAAGGTRGLVAR